MAWRIFWPPLGLAIKGLLNGDMGHRGMRGGPVPVLLMRGNPDNVSFPNLFGLVAPALYPSSARRHDQELTHRMGMPCGSCAWFE